MAATLSALERLPDELLEMIVARIDHPPHSLANVHDEPTLNRCAFPFPSLKALSLTSRHFRAFTTLAIFRHCRVHLTALSFADPYPLTDHSHKPRFSEVEDFLRFLAAAALVPVVKTLLIDTHQNLGHRVPGLLPDPGPNIVKFELGDFWPTLFASLRLSVLTICAPPPTLAFFTSCGIYVGDAWAFSTPLHLLQLRLAPSPPEQNHPAPAPTRELFGIVPWKHCTLNEGSSVQAYNTHEFHSMVAPSIFNGRIRDTPTLPPRTLTAITTFDYIAIFPLYGQVVKVLSFLFILPRLRTIIMQLAPKKESKILEAIGRILQTSHANPWMEFEETYFMIAKEIVQAERRSGVRELVCLDYRPEGLWKSWGHGEDTMNEYWASKGQGHWIKDEAVAEEDTENSEPEGMGTGHTP